ncbi:MAG: MgtC/SapB family protein [Lachnospiraceae bacterium]|nr:MgtC/SapB family protein [Lachnospiraceae bacterium]
MDNVIKLLEYLRELNMLSVLFRILLSVLVGGILGLERERKNRPAGLRTYILVCLGASLVMMTNQYVYNYYDTGDPVRMGAQVISGIGFLGAGTIILTGRNQIKGITTAACLWTAACSGLAIGIGFYEGAIVSAAVIAFIMTGVRKLDLWTRNHSQYLDVFLEFDGGKNAFSEFLEFARQNQFDVTNIQVSQEEFYHKERGKQKTISYTLSITSKVKRTHGQMIDILSKAKGINYIEEL